MKPENIKLILKLLRQHVDDKRDQMLTAIHMKYNTIDSRIQEYQEAYEALNDFEDWSEDKCV